MIAPFVMHRSALQGRPLAPVLVRPLKISRALAAMRAIEYRADLIPHIEAQVSHGGHREPVFRLMTCKTVMLVRGAAWQQ
jgi:hypothetical protein